MFGIDLSLELINKVIITAGVVLFALKHGGGGGSARPPRGVGGVLLILIEQTWCSMLCVDDIGLSALGV